MQPQVSDLEIELMMLCFICCDQHGKVDTPAVIKLAYEKFGVIIPNKRITMNQKHVNMLVQRGLLPEVMSILKRIEKKPRKKRAN